MPSMGPAIPAMRADTLRTAITPKSMVAGRDAMVSADPNMTGSGAPGPLLAADADSAPSMLFPLLGAAGLVAFLWFQNRNKARQEGELGNPGKAKNWKSPSPKRRRKRKYQFADTVSDRLLDEVKTLAQAKQCPKAVKLYLKRRVLGAGASSPETKKAVEHVGREVAFWCSEELREAAEQSAEERETVLELTTHSGRQVEPEVVLKRQGISKKRRPGLTVSKDPDEYDVKMPARGRGRTVGVEVKRRLNGHEQNFVIRREGKYLRATKVDGADEQYVDWSARYEAARKAAREAEEAGLSKSTINKKWNAVFKAEDEMKKREFIK